MILLEEKLFGKSEQIESQKLELDYYLLHCECQNEEGTYRTFGVKVTLRSNSAIESSQVLDLSTSLNEVTAFIELICEGSVTGVTLHDLACDYVANDMRFC